MNRRFHHMHFAFVLLAFISGVAVASDTDRDNVAAAALKGLPTILKQIPQQELSLYGFKNSLEMSRTILGNPIEIFTVHPDELIKYSDRGFSNLLTTTEEWYVPVIVDSENRALLTVIQADGNWQVAGISAADLARELQAFYRQIESKLFAAGDRLVQQPRFVRIFQAYSDFMYVPTSGKEYLYPFSSAQAALGFAPDNLLVPEHVIPLMKEIDPN
jgi:hypothetical protein